MKAYIQFPVNSYTFFQKIISVFVLFKKILFAAS